MSTRLAELMIRRCLGLLGIAFTIVTWITLMTDQGPQQDINSVKVLNEVLDAEDQQLVVLNGDLITGENAYKFNSTVHVDKIVGPIVERGERYASGSRCFN